MAEDRSPDGRHLRRERNRAAVIDAMFELVAEGHLPPSAEALANRAGVSVSSVFRYFDGLDDLQQETVARYFDRYAPLFQVPEQVGEVLDARIRGFVRARLDLYEATAPLARMARHRAPVESRIAASLAETRASLRDQIGSHFAPELATRRRADAADRIALVDTVTSFESWDLLTVAHGRSRSQVDRAWATGIAAVLGG